MGKYQALHKCVAPEHLLLNVRYAISINPDWDHTLDLRTQLSHLYKMLSKTSAIDELILYPEHSPLGRLHYHGSIVINNKFEFYQVDIHVLKSFGSFEIDSIDKPDVWLTYCSKNESYIKPEVLKIKDRSYPLLFRSVDAIMKKKQKEIKWAEKQAQREKLFEALDSFVERTYDEVFNREDLQ